MVGALVKVGKGTWTLDTIRRMLDEGPKTKANYPPANLLVPPQGLFLWKVHYAEET